MSYPSIFVEVAKVIFEQQSIFQKLNNTQRNSVLEHAYHFFYKLSFKSRDEQYDISEKMQVQIALALALMNVNFERPIFFSKTKTVIIYPNRDLFIIDSTKSSNIILDNEFMRFLPDHDASILILLNLLTHYDLQLTITKDESVPFGIVNYINHLINPNNEFSKFEQRQVWSSLFKDYFNQDQKASSHSKYVKAFLMLIENKVSNTTVPSLFHPTEEPLYKYKTKPPGILGVFAFIGVLLYSHVGLAFFNSNASTLLLGGLLFSFTFFAYAVYYTITSIQHYYSIRFYSTGISWTTFLFVKVNFSFQDFQFICMKDISHNERPYLDIIVYKVDDSNIKYQYLRADFSDVEKGRMVYYFPKQFKNRLYTSFRSIQHYQPKVYKNYTLLEIKKVLETKFSYYNKLSSLNKEQFLFRVKEFIELTNFKGGKQSLISDEQIILTSACAQQLTFGLRTGYNYNYFDDILIYPTKYTSPMTGREHVGEMNTSGLIVFSWEDFLRGINIDDDSYNVGLHEFCHALEYMDIINEDMDGCYTDGLDLFMEMSEPYFNKRKPTTFFRDYAYTNRHEFLAVSTEYFFERSEDFERELPMLYKALCQMYNQNPAKLNQYNNNKVNY
ncbi:MAG: zinc-dependent peptidase [Cytophagaceae bacterium]